MGRTDIDNLMAVSCRPMTPAEEGQSTDELHSSLFSELADALQAGDAARQVWTPGFAQKSNSAADVIADNFAGSGDDSLAGLLRIVGMASHSADPALRLQAQAWIATAARKHADWHVGDAA